MPGSDGRKLFSRCQSKQLILCLCPFCPVLREEIRALCRLANSLLSLVPASPSLAQGQGLSCKGITWCRGSLTAHGLAGGSPRLLSIGNPHSVGGEFQLPWRAVRTPELYLKHLVLREPLLLPRLLPVALVHA